MKIRIKPNPLHVAEVKELYGKDIEPLAITVKVKGASKVWVLQKDEWTLAPASSDGSDNE